MRVGRGNGCGMVPEKRDFSFKFRLEMGENVLTGAHEVKGRCDRDG